MRSVIWFRLQTNMIASYIDSRHLTLIQDNTKSTLVRASRHQHRPCLPPQLVQKIKTKLLNIWWLIAILLITSLITT